MRKIFVLLSVLLSMNLVSAECQSVSCTELKEFVVENGSKVGEVASYQTIYSDWLKSVQAYSYDNILFVVAQIKPNQYSLTFQSYIFCGIPMSNWNNFKIYDMEPSWGKKLHKYIKDYTCNCY